MKRGFIITGATSFIGIALIRRLILISDDVVAIVRPNSCRERLLKELFPQLAIVEKELWELEEAVLPASAYSALFHVGWSSDFENCRYNLKGQLQNVEYCEAAVRLAAKYHCDSYLCVGSQAECGLVEAPIDSGTPDNPMTAYAEAKCIAYEKTKSLCAEYGLFQFWPRLLSAFGPYDRASTMVMSCMQACREKIIPELTLAEQIWDYIYVNDVARALIAIVERGMPEKKYAIGSGAGRPLREYITLISEIMDFPELQQGIGKREYAENQVMYLVADISELTRETGFIPKCGFAQGIQKIILEIKKGNHDGI